MSFLVFLLELSPLCAIFYLYLSWNQKRASKPPRCSYKKSLFNSLAVQYCSDLLRKPYRPTIWAFSPILHTAYCRHWSDGAGSSNTEYLQVKSFGLVGICWPQLQHERHGVKVELTKLSPIVVFITDPLVLDNSVQPFIDGAFKSGFRPTVFLPQDCQHLPKVRQNSPILLSKRTDNQADFGESIEYINSRYPDALLYIVGLSFGNATLFQFITENINRYSINGVASISPIWNQSKSEPPVLKMNNNTVDTAEDLDDVPKANFPLTASASKDKRVSFECDRISKGLTSLTDMPNDVFGKFKRLGVPMMVLYSRDDPTYSSDQISRVGGMWKNSDLLVVVETSSGGHVGFLKDFRPSSWAAELVFQYFDAVGKFKDATIKSLFR